MSAVGYAVLPTTISLSGLSKELQKQVLEPTQKAAKQAAESIEKGIGGAVDSASKDVARAQRVQEKASAAVAKAEEQVTKAKAATEAATAKVKIAELEREKAVSQSSSKLAKAEGDYQKLLDSGKASAEQLAQAEAKITQARLQGEADVLKKETALGQARQKSVDAAAGLENAEKGLQGARDKVEESSENLTAAEKRLQDAHASTSDEVAKATKTLEDYGLTADDVGSKLDKSLNVAAAAGVAAAVAAGGALVKLGTDFDAAYRDIRVGTGASGEAFEGLKASALSVLDTVPAMDGGMAQISTTLADLNTRLGLTGEPLEAMTAQFVELSNMGIDADINAVSAAMTQFGVSAESTPESLDMLFQISQATGRSITELTSNLSKSGPALQEFGFGLEESAGLLGALDKAGLDSEKTLGSMTRALSDFAKEGKDPQEALWGTIASIDELTAAGKNAEAIDLANSIFGARGGVGFVAAVESGTFAYDDFLHSIGATEDTILGVAAETRTLGETMELAKQKAAAAFAPLAAELMESLMPAIESAVEHLTEFVDWVKENKELVKTLATTVGIAGTAFVVWRGSVIAITAAQKAFQVATALSTVGIKGMNAAMKANVIGLIVTAIAGLVAGLIYFFTQTETGKELWDKFTTALSEGWDFVSRKFSEGWAWVKEHVFDAFGLKMQELRTWWDDTTGQLAAAWQATKDTFSAVWEAIKSAVFDAWTSYVGQVRDNWRTVTEALSSAWTWVKDTFAAVWNTIKAAVFDAWNTVVAGVKATWDTITGAIVAAWTWTKDQFVYVWTVVKATVFDAWNTAVETVRSVFSTVTAKLSESWTWLKDQLSATWTWVNTNVFDKMKSTLTSVKDSFGTAVEGIRTLWDRVRAAAAAPIRFVVDTVVNEGLIGAWNKVTGWVGLDPVDPVPLGELGNYAHGTSRVPGPRSVGRDNMRFISVDGRHAINLAGQEGIAHQHVVDAIGTHNWDRLNAAAVTGGAPAVRRELGSFAGGGVVGSITGLVNRYFPMMTITSTYRNTNDHHGSGLAVDFSNGTDTTPQMQAAAAWFAQNYGPGLLELIHSPSPYNIKNGRSVGDGFGFYGAGTMAQHRNHVHVAAPAPLGPPGTPPPDLGDLPAGGFFDLGGMVKGLWDKAIGAIGKWTGGGIIGQAPGAFTKAAASKLWDFIKEKITLFDKGGVWKHGTAGVNLSGADEYVFTNKAMRDFQLATESLQVVATELGVAFQDWARATEEQDRMGYPHEWAAHFGSQAATAFADDALSLVGLGGIAGGRLKPSLVNLLNVGADNLNDVYGTRFGHVSDGILTPVSILDDEGRTAGTKLAPVEQPPATDVAAAAGGVDATSTTATVTEPPVKEITFEVKGDAVTTEKVSEMFDKLNGELGDTKVRLKKIEDNQTASVTSGVAGIV